jgi:nitroreductase
MPNIAPTDFPISDIIAARWSPRAFLDKPVEKEKLLHVLEAARWAASSSGLQPWSFIIATNDQPGDYAKILSVLVPFNQTWAANAPVLLLSVANTLRPDGQPNKHAFHDVGAASALLSLEATALGLQAHQMGGVEYEKAKEVFEVPDGYEVVAAIALGYPGDPETLAEPLKSRETAARTRKSLSEIIFGGKFGQSSPLV